MRESSGWDGRALGDNYITTTSSIVMVEIFIFKRCYFSDVLGTAFGTQALYLCEELNTDGVHTVSTYLANIKPIGNCFS